MNTRNYDLFGKVLKKLTDGLKITFTTENIAAGDRFLNVGPRGYDSCTCTFRCHDFWWVYFDNDSPMELADCPDSFYRSILKNI